MLNNDVKYFTINRSYIPYSSQKGQSKVKWNGFWNLFKRGI